MSAYNVLMRVAVFVSVFIMLDFGGSYFDITPASQLRGAAIFALMILVFFAYFAMPVDDEK